MAVVSGVGGRLDERVIAGRISERNGGTVDNDTFSIAAVDRVAKVGSQNRCGSTVDLTACVTGTQHFRLICLEGEMARVRGLVAFLNRKVHPNGSGSTVAALEGNPFGHTEPGEK